MALTRKAIIIGAPGHSPAGSELFIGVQADYVSYEKFLLSDHGGAWDKSEIDQLWHPSSQELFRRLAAINTDYSMTVFCGHGGRYQGHPVIEINPKETIYVSAFRTESKRQLTIIDACQEEIEPTYLFKEGREHVGSGLGKPVNEYRASCRQRYDAGIAAVGEMRALMNGCNIDQVAGSNPLGGYFSYTLLSVCDSWAEQTRGLSRVASQTRTIRQVFEVVGPKVKQEHFPQEPTLESGRSHTSFPFVVA